MGICSESQTSGSSDTGKRDRNSGGAEDLRRYAHWRGRRREEKEALNVAYDAQGVAREWERSMYKRGKVAKCLGGLFVAWGLCHYAP